MRIASQRIVAGCVLALLGLGVAPGVAYATHGRDDSLPQRVQRPIAQRALAHEQVQDALAQFDAADLRTEVHRSPGGDNWAIDVLDETTPIIEVAIDGSDGSLIAVATIGGRYKPGQFGGELVNSPLVLGALAALFMLVMLQGRTLASWRTLDVLAMVSIVGSHLWFVDRDLNFALAGAYLPLAYLFARMAWWFALGPDETPPAPAGSWALSTRALWWLGSVLLFTRYAVNAGGSVASDTAIAGYWGARLMLDGRFVYGNMEAVGVPHGDTYGPLQYLANMPTAWLASFGFEGDRATHVAIVAMNIATDLACVGFMVLLARRWGSQRAAARVFAGWAAFPTGAWVFLNGTNDALMLAMLLGALALASKPVARGLLAGIAAGVKIVPIVTLGVLLTRRGRDRVSESVHLLAGAAIPLGACALYLALNDDGFHRFWNALLGFHPNWKGWGDDNIWKLMGASNAVRVAAEATMALLLLGAAVLPRGPRAQLRAAAGLGAALVATVLVAPHFWYGYLLWMAPSMLLLLVAGEPEPAARSQGGVPECTAGVNAGEPGGLSGVQGGDA